MVERLPGKKVMGIKQSIKAIKNNQAKIVYVAKDADEKLIESVVKTAKENFVDVINIATMKDLGKLCGIDVGAAAAVILDDSK